MSKVVLTSFVAETPAGDEQITHARESARHGNRADPFPRGRGRTLQHWYLVVDTDSGQVSATRDPGAAYEADSDEEREGELA